MAKRATAGGMRRVAEGIYERNGSYLVPIYGATAGGKKGKVWHGPGKACVQMGCTHTRIIDFNSAKKAKRELEAAKAEAGHGAGSKTIRQWAATRADGGQWLQLFPRKEETTNVHNEERAKRLIEWCDKTKNGAGKRWLPKGADSPLDALTEEAAAAYAADCPSAVREARALYNDAVRIKVARRNPFGPLKMVGSRGRKDIRVLSMAELERLSAIAREELKDYGPQFAAMLEVAAWTGVRPGELYLFCFDRREPREGDPNFHKVNYVDFARRRIHVDWAIKKSGVIGRPKYDSMREVVMLPAAEAALRRLVDVSSDGRAFVTTRGAAFTPRNQHYYWDPVRRAFARSLPVGHWLRQRMADDPENGDLDIYELRHFFGSKLAQPPAGVRPATPQEIAQQMGHKDKGALAMEIYIHTDPDQAHADILDAWTQAPQNGDRAVGE